jgi:hypothetical protein
MTKEQALYQSFAACGAVTIAFVGVCHEYVGPLLFPWGPALLGGPIGWHGLGISAIVSGLLLLGGVLGVIRFPVVALALLTAAIGLAFIVFTEFVHRQFHLFAFAAFLAGITTAYFHHRADKRSGST